ncbi:MAG: T9SS type A sorting domain-containing protein [Bacteroidia bacterium]|nr:T9SS type A sorting domain-containing protein [Bacteroidia bacterium]
MRPLLFNLLAILSPLFCLGQNVTQCVTNLAGYELSTAGLVTTVSIGEPAILTLSSNSNTVTQGFLQPEILPCLNLSFGYYPNPTKGEITVDAFGCDVKIQSIEILDMWGRLISTLPPSKDNKVQLGFLSSGMYLLKIFLTNGQSNAFNIVKISQ